MRSLHLLSLLGGVAAVNLPRQAQQSSSPVPPRKDNFYTPTGDWQSAKPGTILASRDVPHPLKDLKYESAHQLLYRTTDSLGNASYAMSTVIIPTNADFSKLLSYQTFYDSPDPDCSPSYTLQLGGLFSLDTFFSTYLEQGIPVSTSDYEGPMAAFTAGVQSGQATLDSIRAALGSKAMQITNISPDAQVVMWGYSGGALASEWAAELQPTYAPELNISGAAMGGTTPNVTSVALSINGKSSAGLIPSGIIGLAEAYPNITSFLNSSFVSADKRDEFWSVRDDCLAEIAVSNSGKNFLSYFKDGPETLFAAETESVVLAGGVMGLHGIPTIPLYVYKSTLDEVSPVADTDALVDKYCRAGTKIHYVRDDFGSHSDEAATGLSGAQDFLSSIFNGTAKIPNGCTIETFNQDGSVKSSTSITATATPTATPSSSGSPSGVSGSNAPASPTDTGAASVDRASVKLAGVAVAVGLLVL